MKVSPQQQLEDLTVMVAIPELWLGLLEGVDIVVITKFSTMNASYFDPDKHLTLRIPYWRSEAFDYVRMVPNDAPSKLTRG